MNPPSCPASDDSDRARTESANGFATTLWATVFTARSTNEVLARDALERLCRIYWRPIYSFVRHRGAGPHDAEDLTQAFFSYLVQRETIKKAEREKGKFRTFLLTALSNFLADEWDKQRRLKRGGHCQMISLADAEENCTLELVDLLTPEKLFDRRWALALVERVAALLQCEFSLAGKSSLFQALQPLLVQEMTASQCAEMAAALGMNEGAVKVALHRLRRRFGQILRHEIDQTVSSSHEIDEEIRHLFAAMSI